MRGWAWLLWGAVLLPAAAGAESPIKSDERVVFFPTFAYRAADSWVLPVHGWIFEPELDSHWRAALTGALGDVLELETTPAERARYERRLRWFLVDNERGKAVPVRIGGRRHRLAESGADGHFNSALTIPAAALAAAAGDFVPLRAITRKGDERRFSGRVQLVGPQGVMVVSDIDDTIKVTEVLDRRAMIRNTFYRPFRAVPGMAATYRRWAGQGAVFWYLSASPWQLWPALQDFMEKAGFPRGAVRLRRFRFKDGSLVDFLGSSADYKTAAIRKLLARFPERQLVLVGDAGERDPEIYGRIARAHPRRIRQVYIRRLPGADVSADRLAQAFAGIEPARWTLFEKPSQLGELKP